MQNWFLNDSRLVLDWWIQMQFQHAIHQLKISKKISWSGQKGETPLVTDSIALKERVDSMLEAQQGSSRPGNSDHKVAVHQAAPTFEVTLSVVESSAQWIAFCCPPTAHEHFWIQDYSRFAQWKKGKNYFITWLKCLYDLWPVAQRHLRGKWIFMDFNDFYSGIFWRPLPCLGYLAKCPSDTLCLVQDHFLSQKCSRTGQNAPWIIVSPSLEHGITWDLREQASRAAGWVEKRFNFTAKKGSRLQPSASNMASNSHFVWPTCPQTHVQCILHRNVSY